MNRNINIVLENSDKLEGYENVNIQDMNNIINGYVNNIVCECLDNIEFMQRLDAVKAIIGKLAFGGTATFKFINATMFANRIIKNETDVQKISDIISGKRSLWTESMILEVFSSLPNLKIDKNYIEHVHTVITVTKAL
jgi:hypothetical protein